MAFYGSVGEINYSALSGTKSETAVSIFVYDTTKDSDGGAWRKRTQNTSWYNETLNTATRGARRDFPSVAVIIAQSNVLTIYDGDDPDLPMWMVFNRGTDTAFTSWWDGNNTNTAQSVFALNGVMVLGTTPAGAYGAEFISDKSFILYNSIANIGYRYNGSLINRNSPVISRICYESFASTSLGVTAYSVAMTVLPNAPIDPDTGLPVPTIGVGTESGSYIMRDNKTITVGTEANSSWNVRDVFFDSNYNFWGCEGTDYSPGIQLLSSPPYSTIAAIGTGTLGYQLTTQVVNNYGQNTSWPHFLGTYGSFENVHAPGSKLIYNGSRGGVTLLSDNVTNRSNSMVAYITSSYNTGWMHGNIRGAWLSDTSAVNVTGTELILDGSGNWAGDFDVQADVDSWTALDSTNTLSSGTMQITRTGGAGLTSYKTFTTVAGVRYVATATVNSSGSRGDMYIINGTGWGGTNLTSSLGTNGQTTTSTVGFTALSTTTTIAFAIDVINTSIFIDNVSVRREEPDRSIHNKGLQVFGTVTKSAVATGSNLVAYSGFSASNYLAQPSAFAPGTGDFSISFWVKPGVLGSGTSGNYFHIFSLGTSTSGGQARSTGFTLKMSTNSTDNPNGFGPYFYSADGTLSKGTISNDNYFSVGVWSHCVAMRRSGIPYFYINGKLSRVGTSWTTNITDTYATIGTGIGFGEHAGSPSFALLRYSFTAPTPEQINQIYENEKVLFQSNSQCTLFGSSNAITGLAYDNSLDRWHAGTSSGISSFSGLERISNTTTAVTTGISASNGLVIDQ